jgi:hypothetical protein
MRLAGVLAMILALAGVRPALASHAQAVTVQAFYATSGPDYDRWVKNSSIHPKHLSSFPSGTRFLGFYFSAATASPSSSYYVVLRKDEAATVDVAGSYALTKGSDSYGEKFGAFGVYSDGIYHADLIIDDTLVKTVTFTIGFTATVRLGSLVATLYPISVASRKAMKALAAYPPRTTRFPAISSEVDFYFLYVGATPNVSSEEVIVTGPYGTIMSDGAPYTLPKASGGYWTSVQAAGFPRGNYTATLLIGGAVFGKTTFVIG